MSLTPSTSTQEGAREQRAARRHDRGFRAGAGAHEKDAPDAPDPEAKEVEPCILRERQVQLYEALGLDDAVKSATTGSIVVNALASRA